MEAQGAWPFSGLWFEARDEEKTFSEGYACSQFRLVDDLYRRFGWVIGLTCAWRRVADDLQAGGVSWSGGLAVTVVLISSMLDVMWFVWQLDKRPEARTAFVLAKRTLVGVVPAVLGPLLYKDPVTTGRSFFRFLFVSTGVFPLAFPTFSCPLLARHQLLLQAPIALFMAFHAPAHVCAAGVITAESEPFIFAAWRWLDALCTGALVKMPTPRVHQCCRDLVVTAHVVFGFCLPSYVLWASECRARLRFKSATTCQLNWNTAVVHGMLLITVLSSLWTFLHAGAWM